MSDKQPTESAVRAAQRLYWKDRVNHPGASLVHNDDLNKIAETIDSECHLPEIKEALEKAEKAITVLHQAACEGECAACGMDDRYGHATDCFYTEALAAIEKVKG